MPLDERTLRRFQFIRENVARLERLRSLPQEEFLGDFRNVDAAKHLLQTAIEATIDVAVQVLARLKEPLPEHHAEVFESLVRHGVLPSDRFETYQKMVAFRNRVVHLDERVDDRLVHEIVQKDLGDFDRFIGEIVRHLGP